MKLIACALLILCLFTGLANTCEYDNNSEPPESGDVPAGDDEVTPCNLEPPANFHPWAEDAINWAEDRLGSDSWYDQEQRVGLCLRFVANAFRQQGPEPEGEWHSAWEASQNLVLCEQDPIGAPRGALIFFGQTENNQYGHVGIYLGNSELLHAYGSVRINDLDEVQTLDNGYLIGPCIGWAYPPEKWRPAATTSEGIAEALQILDWRIVDGGHYRPRIEIEFKESGDYPPCDVEIILRDPYGNTLVGKSIRLWWAGGHWWEPFYLDDYYLRAPTEGHYELVLKDEEGEYITILPLEFKPAYQVVEASLIQDGPGINGVFGFHFEITIENTGNVVLYCCSVELNGNGTSYTFEPLYEPNSRYRDKAIQPGDEKTIKHYWWSHDRYFEEYIQFLTITMRDSAGEEVVFTSSCPIINQ